MSVPSMNIAMNNPLSQRELGGNSNSSQSIEMARMSLPASGSPVLLGKRMKPSPDDATISKTLFKETINWTLQPLESKVGLAKILSHQSKTPPKESSGGGQKIFLAPPEDESCHEDRRLVIDT